MRTEVAELGVIDYDSYKILHQTNAVFSEGLRLHPSVPKNGWTVLKDDVLPNGGPMVKAGDIVFWSSWVMGRDESIWGPDAKEFTPSRWIDEQGEMKKESQWKAHMFNGGYRLCLGECFSSFRGSRTPPPWPVEPFLDSALTSAVFSFAQGWTSPSTKLPPVSHTTSMSCTTHADPPTPSTVLAAISREFDLSFAPGWLESVPMMATEQTPRYQPSLTLPMVSFLPVPASCSVGD